MTREELADQMFGLLKRIMPKKDSRQLWAIIAKTSDRNLINDYKVLMSGKLSLFDWEKYKDEQREFDEAERKRMLKEGKK